MQQLNRVTILAMGIAIGVAVGVSAMLIIRPKPDTHAMALEPSPSLPSVRSPEPLPEPAAAPRLTRENEPQEVTDIPTKVRIIADTPAEFAAQIRGVLSGEVDEETQLAFWQAVRSSDDVDRLIDGLQGDIEDAPENVEDRLTLGLAYVAKIWSAPDGPEKGIWAGKAEGVWKQVLDIEPNNWDAQRNIAFSYSQYPAFLNKTGEAIAEYEKTLAIQEAASEPREAFANSYLEMARLQLDSGDPGSALSTLSRGAAEHPENVAIAEQLEVIESSYVFEELPDAEVP